MDEKESTGLSERQQTCRRCLLQPYRDCIKHESGIRCWCAKDPDHMKDVTDPGLCEDCKDYKSKYIQFPLTVSDIVNDEVSQAADPEKTPRKQPVPCVVTPVIGNPENKAYLGLYLGDWPWFLTSNYNESTKVLRTRIADNPLIYVFGPNTLVYGAESWWTRISTVEELERELSKMQPQPGEYVTILKTILASKAKKEP